MLQWDPSNDFRAGFLVEGSGFSSNLLLVFLGFIAIYQLRRLGIRALPSA